MLLWQPSRMTNLHDHDHGAENEHEAHEHHHEHHHQHDHDEEKHLVMAFIEALIEERLSVSARRAIFGILSVDPTVNDAVVTP